MISTLKRIVPVSVLLLVFLAVTAALSNPSDDKKATTLDNLQTAYNGESNAHAKYLAFAEKADEEGYTKVASLFRAAARAEEVHANNHAEVIKKMGGVPTAKIETPVVGSTKENLKAAIKGETYEKNVMYPKFLKLARLEKNSDAIQTFTYAKAAETEHAKLYTKALNELSKWKGGKLDFYVCTVCGYTVQKITFQNCPVCSSPADVYVKVD